MYDDIMDNPSLIAEVFQQTLFKNILEQNPKEEAICTHENIVKDDNGINVCSECGIEFDSLDFSKEWRNFGVFDNRLNRDQSRCHSQKSTPKGIKEVLNSHSIDLSQALTELVEYKFNKVLEINENKGFRGQGREATIAVCLFHAYQNIGENRTTGYVRSLFNVNQKNMSSAMTRYYIAFPEDATKHMTPEMLIPWIMSLTGVGAEHKERILAISRYLSATSQLVERSNPQSVAAATIYFYLCLFPDYKNTLGLTKTKFAEKAKLSDITISKIVKDMAEISKIAAEDWKCDAQPNNKPKRGPKKVKEPGKKRGPKKNTKISEST